MSAAAGPEWAQWTGAVVAVALSAWVGDALRAWLAPGTRAPGERFAVAWLLGALFSACTALAVGASGMPWGAATLGGAHVVLAAACTALARRRGGARRGADARAGGERPLDEPGDASARGGSGARGSRALRLGLALALLLGAAHTLREGTRFADSHAVWALRAKVVAEDGGFGGAYWRDWSDAHDRRAYPPLLSLAGAWVHTLGATPDAATTKLVNLGFYLALAALVHAALARRLGARAALGATLLFALSRPVLLGAGWGVADLPLAAYLLAAVGELARRAPRSDVLVAAWLAGAVACKFEGAWCAGLVLFAALTLRTQGRSRARLLACGTPALLLLGAWLVFVQRLGVPLEFGPSAAAPPNLDTLLARLGLATTALARAAWSPEWAWLAPLGIAARLRRRASVGDDLVRLGTRVLCALLVVDVAVYAFQAGDTRALLASTLERLLLQAFPLAWVACLAAWGTSGATRGAASDA